MVVTPEIQQGKLTQGQAEEQSSIQAAEEVLALSPRGRFTAFAAYACRLDVCYTIERNGIKVESVLKTPIKNIMLGEAILNQEQPRISFDGGVSGYKAAVVITLLSDNKQTELEVCGRICAGWPVEKCAQGGGSIILGRQELRTREFPQTRAARSTKVVLVNSTDSKLNRARYELPHGAWTTFPPETIEAFRDAEWASESDGFMTGTEGRVWYSTQYGTVMLHWDNPYVGSNKYDWQVPDALRIIQAGGDGNNTTVEFVLLKKSN